MTRSPLHHLLRLQGAVEESTSAGVPCREGEHFEASFAAVLRPEVALRPMVPGVHPGAVLVSGPAFLALARDPSARDQLLAFLEFKGWLPGHTAKELGLHLWTPGQQGRCAGGLRCNLARGVGVRAGLPATWQQAPHNP